MINVLVACEESQIITIKMREAGCNCFSCDLQYCSGGHPEWHIQSDVLKILNGGIFYTCDGDIHLIKKWDIIIAHPPCTYLSCAGASCLFNSDHSIKDYDRYNKGVYAAQFFYEFFNCNCDFVVIENPRPLKIFNLPQCTQVIEPYYFGDKYSKRTYLWLKGFNPLIIPDYDSTGVQSWTKIHSSSKIRSKTFNGIASAIVDQFLSQYRFYVRNKYLIYDSQLCFFEV